RDTDDGHADHLDRRHCRRDGGHARRPVGRGPAGPAHSDVSDAAGLVLHLFVSDCALDSAARSAVRGALKRLPPHWTWMPDALTDGLVVLRYLFGLTGAPFMSNALGGTATRADA